MAVKGAISLFKSSQWSDKFKLTIECDCKLVVDWFLNPVLVPLTFKFCTDFCLQINDGYFRRFVAVLREVNGLADSLAKKGISRVMDHVKFFED
ncbi:hypothetical protein V6N13_083729 [Hibiscus sabdariffa]